MNQHDQQAAMNDERTSETPEPSDTARMAAEAVTNAFTVLARTSGGLTSFDEAEPNDVAAIIERETGSGEAVAVIKDLMGQWSPLAPEYDRARAFLAKFNRD